MATANPTLSDPDKLGLLLNLRQKMDALSDDRICDCAQSILKLLSIQQLKSFLFVGFNSIKQNIKYDQLSQMKLLINTIIEQEKQLKEKSKPNGQPNIEPNDKKTIPKIPKNASLTQVIPFDIISNYICHFLKMSSITQLAQCDRKLAIICHTPISINNLMHRYDQYEYYDQCDYVIDGNYYNMSKWTVDNIHRYKNIEQLAVAFSHTEKDNIIEILNACNKIKHLFLYSIVSDIDENYFYRIKNIPLLETIAFCQSTFDTDNIICIIGNIQKKKNNNLKSIAFIDNDLQSLLDWDYFPHNNPQLYENYNYISDFILPLQPNSLEVLKFENSVFIKTDEPETKNTNDEFMNINRIKTSLQNLKGFVYGQKRNHNDIFINLSRIFLSNMASFKHLTSIHVHCMDLLSLVLNSNPTTLNNISEICITVPLDQILKLKLIKKLAPDLHKLCLVVNISNNARSHLSNFQNAITYTLKTQKQLKLLQIVIIAEDKTNTNRKFCDEILAIISEYTAKLMNSFQCIRNGSNYLKVNRSNLCFKFHVKLCHSILKPKCSTYMSSGAKAFGNALHNMITNFLTTCPLGKIQFQYSYNVNNHFDIGTQLKYCMGGLHELFRVSIKQGGSLEHLQSNSGYCCNALDYKQYAISVCKQNISDYNNINYEQKWKVDCRYCCNTPWI